MNQNPQAWLLKDSAGGAFAVSEIEMVAYERSPHIFQVPASPAYCCELIFWQQRLIPLLHLSLLFAPHEQRDNSHIGIFAYQQETNSELDYLALSLHTVPHKIEVKEDTIAPLPAGFAEPQLRPIAISCFNHEGMSVPVLDIAYLASATLRDELSSRSHR